jgi:hypothetical protein
VLRKRLMSEANVLIFSSRRAASMSARKEEIY